MHDGRWRPKIVYAVPGVPYEMTEMVTQHVLPDLLERSGQRAVIVSRSLKTWGTSESGLAEMIESRVDEQTNPTIAFLARGIEGIYVRMTAKAPTEAEARALLDAEDARAAHGARRARVRGRRRHDGVRGAAPLRGARAGRSGSPSRSPAGFVGARIANVPGASRTFRGSIASYATEVKRSVLGVTAEGVVSEEAVKQMAEGAQRVLGADVAHLDHRASPGPTRWRASRSARSGTGIAIPGHETEAVTARLPFDRERIRQFSTISVLNLLRMRLLALP